MKARNTALQTKSGKKRARFHVQSLRLGHLEWTALRARARASGRSVSDYIRRIIAVDEVRALAREGK